MRRVKRTHSVHIYLNDIEYSWVTQQATNNQIAIAEVIRELINEKRKYNE